MNYHEIFTLEGLLTILSLTLLEIVLGIDNIIFVAIVSGKLPREHQAKARTIGLTLALLIRVALLFTLTWIIRMKAPLFSISGYGVSVRDLILFSGGVFLIYSSIKEIIEKVSDKENEVNTKAMALKAAIFQIVILDVVFSFDSILTAIGVADDKVLIMVIAVIISLGVMLAFSGVVSDFINKHPSIKMIALVFLLMIGFILVADGLPDSLEIHFPKEYLYFSMGFAMGIELLNMRYRRNHRRHLKEKEDRHRHEENHDVNFHNR
ncbi:MAG: TerC family protein [Bacteroidetes bacterium]|nr:TerC family protein [Bacteroidota bacterium]